MKNRNVTYHQNFAFDKIIVCSKALETVFEKCFALQFCETTIKHVKRDLYTSLVSSILLVDIFLIFSMDGFKTTEPL